MSQREPTRCYVYQPGPPSSDGKIYELAGPGSKPHKGKKFTRKEADHLCEIVNATGETEPCCECGNDYPRADLIRGEIFCKPCRKKEAERLKK